MNFNKEIVSKILRDADKLDILENQGNEINDKSAFNKEKLKNIYQQKCCMNDFLENEADKIIKNLCFVYDINFKYSFRYIKEKNIIQKKLLLLEKNSSDDINFCEIKQLLNDYIDKNA